MIIPASTIDVYRCPGEDYDITRSVHLSRLAVSYSKCRTCPHAPGAAIAFETSAGTAAPGGLAEDKLLTSEGIRGRYLNDLTRATAARIAGALASCLWDDVAGPEAAAAGALRVPPAAEESLAPEFGTVTIPGTPLPAEGVRLLAPGRPGPSVVLGHDDRPSSPEIVTGVGQALRRMGCQVVDVGLATRPCLVFAVDHLRAAGGVHVTGAGCDPGWTGLDFLARGSVPCSSPGMLDRIAARYREGYSRPSRRPGSQRTFQAAVPYEASLWKHFHALRPFKIALASPNRTVRDLFTRIFRKLACRLLHVETPTRVRSSLEPSDPDLERLSRRVCEAGAHLGMLVDDDGEQCVLFDENGRLVPPQVVARLLTADLGNGATAEARCSPTVAVDSPDRRRRREEVTATMRQEQLTFAVDGAGRYWFAEAYPACDALLTLVHLLQALSRSDTPLSEVAAVCDC